MRKMSFFGYLTALFLVLPLVVADSLAAGSNPEFQHLGGVFSQNLYSSPSYAIICSFEQGIADSSSFFITDDFTNNFESVTFGYEVSDQLMIWNLRRQKLGMNIKAGASSKGASLTQNNYISTFYAESPYDFEIVSKIEKDSSGVEGEAGLIRVNTEELKQNHGYWLGAKGGWLFSIQTLPPVSSGNDSGFSRKTIKENTFKVLDSCNFNTP